MRETFEQELSKLHEELIKMGTLCENAIDLATRALLESDEEKRCKVFSLEQEINRKERDIERISLHLLLTQQPVASDLRNTSAALKMVSDMERIGDQAADIADIAKELRGKALPCAGEIEEMGKAANIMVTESIDSFVKGDLDLAHKVMRDDDIVDRYFSKIRDHLVELIRREPETGEDCMDVLMIIKYFERIGDHATNIAEWVEYSKTGQYKGERL